MKNFTPVMDDWGVLFAERSKRGGGGENPCTDICIVPSNFVLVVEACPMHLYDHLQPSTSHLRPSTYVKPIRSTSLTELIGVIEGPEPFPKTATLALIFGFSTPNFIFGVGCGL